jgi:hypothetical protein
MSRGRVIGGVTYIPVQNPTVRHDCWIMGRVKEAGLGEVELREGERPEDWAKRFMFQLMSSDSALLFMGGVLVPKDTVWSPKVAQETARHLGDLTSDEDKEVIFGYLLTTLIAFFESGLTSLWSTRKS